MTVNFRELTGLLAMLCVVSMTVGVLEAFLALHMSLMTVMWLGRSWLGLSAL